MVPTFTADRSRREVPSYAPAISPRLRRRHSPWPPRAATLTNPEFPTPRHEVLVRIADQPESTGLELAGDLRGVKTLVPRVHLLLLLAGPRPSGSAGPSRRCRGCLPPSPASPGSGCPQLRYAAATAQRRSRGRTGAPCLPSSQVGFSGPPSAPDVRLSPHPALHGFPWDRAAHAVAVLAHGVGML